MLRGFPIENFLFCCLYTMGKTRDSDIATRAQVVALKGQNLTNCKIAQLLKRSESLVGKTLSHFKETGGYEN
jgi:transposase